MRFSRNCPPLWLDAGDLNGLDDMPAPLALAADLADPALASLLALAPTGADEALAARRLNAEGARFLGRRALLRHIVGRIVPVEAGRVAIAADDDGAPRVAGRPEIFVSLSGRDDLCLAAVGPSPLGVDLEPLAPAATTVWSVLRADERAMLRDMPDDAGRHVAFLRIWTLKEAYLKALGLGLRRAPESFAVRLDPAGILDGAGPPPFAQSLVRRIGRRDCAIALVAAAR